MPLLETTRSTSEGAAPLSYATPEPMQRRGGVAAAVAAALIVFFVCMASIGVFIVVCNEHQDVWAAAVGVTALSAMAAASVFFLTRRW